MKKLKKTDRLLLQTILFSTRQVDFATHCGVSQPTIGHAARGRQLRKESLDKIHAGLESWNPKRVPSPPSTVESKLAQAEALLLEVRAALQGDAPVSVGFANLFPIRETA